MNPKITKQNTKISETVKNNKKLILALKFNLFLIISV